MKLDLRIALAIMLIHMSCSDESGFVGGGETRKEVKKPSQTIPYSSQNYSRQETPPPQIQNRPPPIIPYIPYIPPVQTLPPIPDIQNPPPNTAPDNIVDGKEVFNSCSACEQRAQLLARQNGFSVLKSNAVNVGFYKIDPSKNLCDIHFLANQNIPIDDHEGVDTVGNNQIILYCPCNCGWSSSNDLGTLQPYY